VPIFSGKTKPLKRKLVQAVVHGASGLAGLDTSKTKFTLTNNADQKIIELIRQYPRQINIITLGPLTNLARAFNKDPQLPFLIKMTLSDFNQLKGSSLYQPIKNMMRQYIVGISKEEGVKAALIYDAVAAYFLINPKAFRLEPMDIFIETKGEFTSGMTVVEKRKQKAKNINIKVAMEVDKNLLIQDLIKIL
jgi:inosine-uridine nucleoside N-ribohydrolase